MRENPGEQEKELETEVPRKPTAGAAPDGTTLKPGTVLLYTYQILRAIGAGGMGEVYRARHLQLGTDHAIKIVRPELVESQTARTLFVQEASLLREVRHDAVVQYDGLFQDEGGRIYLVMEFVEGRRLSDLMRERGPLSVAEVWKLYGRLARGLAAVHGRGVTHRDLSPDNIIFPGDQPERAKLIDFGIAKLTETQAAGEDDGFAGKYVYASPEQLGASGGQVDARSDIYSLGLVLAAAAAGQPLPMGSNREEALAARRKAPRLPRAIPRALRKELKTLLRPTPHDRPSAQDLVKRDLIRGRNETRSKEGRTHPLALTLGYGSAVVAGVGLAVWLSAATPTLLAALTGLLPWEKPRPAAVVRPVDLPKPPDGGNQAVEKPVDDKTSGPAQIPPQDRPEEGGVKPERVEFKPAKEDEPHRRGRTRQDLPAVVRRQRKPDRQWGPIERGGATQTD